MHQLYIIIVTISTTFALDFISNYTQDISLQIKLPDGVIQGTLKTTKEIGMPYYAFEGIPYAKPPVGNLRFQPPEAPIPWNGVLNANGEVPICIQIPSKSKDYYESEDCLYINVYTPQSPTNDSEELAVMVWIYGGGFHFGQALASYYGPDYILNENVIVVHFNYRINVYGFLSTGDLASPGNYGLKDQQFALQWVYNNIKYFGGNSEKITLFGESAGAASVQYHLLSLKSQTFFQHAISESGSVLCPWAFQPNPQKIAWEIGALLGIYTDDSIDLVQQLREVNARTLTRAAIRIALLNTVNIGTSLPFAPVMEPVHETAFLSQNTFEQLKNGDFPKIPYIVGFNSEESAIAKPGLQLLEPLLRLLGTKSEVLIPTGMNTIGDRTELGKEIKHFYFENTKPVSEQYVEYISDSYFYRPIIKAASFLSPQLPLYMYRFSYEGYYLGRKALSFEEDQNLNGVMHSEEIWYLFAREDLKWANADDKLTRRRMVKLWTNFAKYGNPVPKPDELLQNITWHCYQNDGKIYLDINKDLMIRQNPRRGAIEFWEDVYDKYGKPPYNTY